MDIVLGVDIGGSTTKIVGLRKGELVGMLQVRAADQITSMYGAIGNFLRAQRMELSDVSSIVLTGVGATLINEHIYGIKTRKLDEFLAIGHGALRMSGLEEAIVVSMGTGIAFVRASKSGITHIGGSGVGGGTIIGLASQMLGKSDVDAIIALAAHGRLENVDLLVRDIVGQDIPSLPADLTASNFGSIKSAASESDVALGIVNMVFQTAGMLAVFAARNDTIRDIVLTGTLTTFPQVKEISTQFASQFGLRFHIPPDAVFATALGAARCANMPRYEQSDRWLMKR
ncbi:MAG: type II pantothenate kinase [Oscillospiraceae bacterium]|nr:type II pantothenate kinase [Oscillospiraceae bacterium]